MKSRSFIFGLLAIITFETSLFGQCSFSLSNSNPCAGEEINVTVDNPQAGMDYSWDLDADGTTDINGSSFDYSFPSSFNETIFPITLFENGDSCITQDVTVLASPDPSIGVPPGIVTFIGNELKACNGDGIFDLEIFNTSNTFDQNLSYTIIWGDGSPPEVHDNSTFNNTSTISHLYVGFGYYTMFITAEHENGCIFTNNYIFYNGGNPSVGLVIPGNTVGLCAPATLDFPIINSESNPPGTEYNIFINGVKVDSFVQENLPDVFTYTFEESSCGETTSTNNYQNAFDIKIVASNPCNSSTATIEPIEVSEPPELQFDILPPTYLCEGAIFEFENTTENVSEVISGNPSTCIEVLNPNWSISGNSGEDWNLVDGSLFGSNNVEIEFLQPGVYTITMSVISFACGEFTLTQDITIFEPPNPLADFDPSSIITADGGCSPATITFNNQSEGLELNYNWDVISDFSWEFEDSTDINSINPTITFEEGGSYDIVLTVANPCSEVTWDTTLVFPGPPSLNLLPIPDSCASATLSFDSLSVAFGENGSPITNLEWSFPGSDSLNSNEAFPNSINYDSAGIFIVQLEAENACGQSIVADTFEVQAITDLILPGDTTFCASESEYQLTALPPGGTWSGNGINSQGLFTPSDSVIGTNELVYNYGTGACFLEESIQIDILPIPQVDAGPDETLCSNEGDISLSGSPANGIWTSTDSIYLDNANFLTSVAGAGNYELLYQYNGANGCTGEDTLEIIVHPAPNILASDTSYCNTSGATSLPLPSPAGGLWSGPGVVDPSGFFDPFTAGGAGNYTLTYTMTNSLGCTESVQVNVGIVDPVSVDAGLDTSLCIYETSYDLSQYSNPAGGTWSGNLAGLEGDLFTPEDAGPGQYLLYYAVGAGNCAVQDSLLIEVIEPEQAVAGNDESVCVDAPGFQLTNFSPTNGVWTGTGITDPIGGMFDPALADVGNHVLTYNVIDPVTGCESRADKTIIVNPLPEPVFSVPELACINEDIQMNNQSTSGDNFDWNFGNGETGTGENPSTAYLDTGLYTIQLLATSNAGCQAQIDQSIQIAEPPTALFSPSIDEGCDSLEISISNNSNGFETNFHWNFGNGVISTEANPDVPIVYPAGLVDTQYIIQLEVNNLCGMDTHQDTILIHPYPIVDFGFTVDTGCAPLNVTFSNISTGSPTSYDWNFSNGQYSTDSLPAPQIFAGDTLPIVYPITLIAGNSCGADSLTKDLIVEPEVVDAFINVSNTQGCAPLDIDFENFSTPGTFISWDFGDGNTSDDPNPSHSFAEPGTYLVRQYASNSCADDSTSITITVLPSPEVDFTYSPNLCSGQEIQFTNLFPDLAGVIWDFNTGDSSTLNNPLAIFPNEGVYNVSLTGTSMGNGCPSTITKPVVIATPPEIDLEIENSDGCMPLTVTFDASESTGTYFTWDFGDGNTSVDLSPTHTFTEEGFYPVLLTVTEPNGCSKDTLFTEVFVRPLPQAQFKLDQESACGLPASIDFINQSSGAEGFTWMINEESYSSNVNPSMEFNESGPLSIELIARNQFGCIDQSDTTIMLYDTPYAEFELDTIEGCEPLQIRFANYSTGNNYYWDFGDGQSSIEENPIHTFESAGNYPISLVTAFDDLCRDTMFLETGVQVYPQAHADLEWTEELFEGKPTGVIQFTNLSTNADSYLWDFGDGETSTEVDPSHRYYINSSKPVYLRAISSYGCSDDTSMVIVPQLFGDLYVPNAFAPVRGAEDASLFLPKGIGLREYRLQIFSTYGKLLWESTLLKDGQPAEGWNGTHNGYPLPQDVYVWKIYAVFEDGREWRGMNFEKGKFKRMGSVTLIR